MVTTSSPPSLRTTASRSLRAACGATWPAHRERGRALVNAFRGIENANQDTLYGIFGNAAWTNKDKLSDARLLDLIEHFSSKALTNGAVSPDVFGQAYEYLIKRFADQSNKKTGEYYTPRQVVRLLVDMLDPAEGETVYDPACGTGGMLIEVIEHVKANGGDAKSLWGKLYGQEKVLATSGIARMNMFLHGVEDFHIVRGDTLREPAFFTGSRLAQFDIVIANPPFSLKNWGHEAWTSDRGAATDWGACRRRATLTGAGCSTCSPQPSPPPAESPSYCHRRRTATGRAIPRWGRGPHPRAHPSRGQDRSRRRSGVIAGPGHGLRVR